MELNSDEIVVPSTPPPPPTPAPVVTPEPAPDTLKSDLLPRLLGLLDEKPVKPADAVDEEDETPPKKQAIVETVIAAKPAEPPPIVEPPKKVAVKEKKKFDLKGEVQKAVEESLKTAPAAPAPVAAVPPPTPAPAPVVELDLTPEEKEELDLAVYAESKDPTKKGLSDKFRKFYQSNKEFLEKASAKATSEGDNYDPATDQAYKKFLAANEPKLSASDRKQLWKEKVSDDARASAIKDAEAKFNPQISALERKTRELEHRPKIEGRVGQFIDEVAEGMPEDVMKFFNENGQDMEKTKAEFPLEHGIITRTVSGAQAMARELLEVKRGLKPFEPEKDARHKYLLDFVNQQGSVFERSAPTELVRDGKSFVHPAKYDPANAGKTWTFSDDDVLAMLKFEAQTQAKRQIKQEEARLKSLGFDRAKKITAPSGTVAPAKKEVESSPRTPSASLPGSAAAEPATPPSLLSVLGIK